VSHDIDANVHFPNAFVDLGIFRKRIEFRLRQLYKSSFPRVADSLLLDDEELLFGEGLFLADFLQELVGRG
jgi:hypothetical protein